ncbi:hypothetical protein EV426DRAFT_579516 [Tirmania nivea]|nr:hypothetical protein EV426DRAFT_579516 [Tirmania nivea]
MGVTDHNSHIFRGQQVLPLNAYRSTHSDCMCETLPPHYSYSFAPWLATTRNHHPQCTAFQISNGYRRHVLAPQNPSQSHHLSSPPLIPSQPAPTPTLALVSLDTSEDLPSTDNTPLANTEMIMGDATSTPTNTKTESTTPSTVGPPGDGFCRIWTMLVQPIWTWIVQTFTAWTWGKVSPQPQLNNKYAEKLLVQWDELQEKLKEEREKREKAEKALAEVEKERALWEDRHRREVERREEVVRMWQEWSQADEAKADKVKTALEEELRTEREKVVEEGKAKVRWMGKWQREWERAQDLAKMKEAGL